jgi:hypothetical protein
LKLSLGKGHLMHNATKGRHPFFVKEMKERNVYCCIYHVEMNELQIGKNNMCTKVGIHLDCGYNCEEVY